MDRPRGRATHRVRSAAARAGRLLPANGSVDDLIARLAAERGRPITVMTAPLSPAEPSGLWLATESVDWIVVPEAMGPVQRTAVICHELSHILLEHVPLGSDAEREELARVVAPHVDQSVALRILARYGYSDVLESEAESLGTVLVGRLAQRAERQRVIDDTVSDRLR